jgi:crotonobetainyl-CoA:carnitine CoA-transferase CaiB-like acyl-CoA transferase
MKEPRLHGARRKSSPDGGHPGIGDGKATSSAGPKPLAGLRVVEFSHMVMGPTSGLVLGDLGAEVIKVEPMGDGDNTRRLAGAGAGFFVAFNRNKKSIQVDLKSERGLAFARRLIAAADIMTENFRPGALEALGLGAEEMRRLNPRLVYCSLKGFLSGPYEHRTALDEVVQMMGGLAYMTGPPGRPLRAGASVNDIMGGMFAVIAILSAIHERQRTGVGATVKAGLFENNVFLVGSHMMQYAVTGKAPAPMPNRLSAWAVYDLFDTADDDQVFVGVVSDGQWAAFCDAFGLPDLKADPALGSNRERVLMREAFMPRLRALLGGMAKHDVIRICEEIGLPYAPITRPEDLFDDPQVNAPGALTPVTLPDGRTVRSPALPLEIDGARPGVSRDVPAAGADTAEVARALGLGDAEIAGLIRDGIVRQAV